MQRDGKTALAKAANLDATMCIEIYVDQQVRCGTDRANVHRFAPPKAADYSKQRFSPPDEVAPVLHVMDPFFTSLAFPTFRPKSRTSLRLPRLSRVATKGGKG